MKQTLFSLFMFLSTVQYAQTEYSIPDSVLSVEINSVNGESLFFKDVLDQNKNKRIVIDFWASWCKDCVSSLDKIEELTTLGKQAEVEIIMLSVDKDQSKWQEFVSKMGIDCQHYRIIEGWDGPMSNYLQINWIPRYIVLDESGQIILSDVINANDERLVQAIQNYTSVESDSDM